MKLPNSLVKQSDRVFGPPPPKEAPKIDAWIYVRGTYIRLLPFAAPLWIALALAGAPTWLWILQADALLARSLVSDTSETFTKLSTN